MDTETQALDLSVAILMDDLSCAKEVAGALRQNNIFAHLYESLDDFWVACNVSVPDLVIVDVTKMSQGSIKFKNHPRVLDRSLFYAFFSKDSTKILLQSTLGLNPVAYIHYDSSLAAQLSCLVKNRIQNIKLFKEKNELDHRIHRIQSRSQRILSERSQAEEFRAQFEFIRNFCSEIEDEAMGHDFIQALVAKLEVWDGIDSYGIYELNQSGQKLISPEISRKKHHPFPALWLGQVNAEGIEVFAQDMAYQVASDLFETSPVVIKIFAGSSCPEILLFLSFKQDHLQSFPWDILESMLSSSYRKLKLYRDLPHYNSQFLPMWEALDSMDKLQNTSVNGETKIVALNLIPLVHIAKKRSSNKFFWSAFFNEFFIQLSGRIQKSTKLSLFGPWHILFFIPRENLELETQMLQNFICQFSYWKYFEDNSQILSEEMLPELKLIPPSSANYLRLFEKDFQEMELRDEQKHLLINHNPKAKRLSVR